MCTFFIAGCIPIDFRYFRLQLLILKRAFQLLKPGGRMVYSTCSMNPVENEAVIAAALNSHSGNSMKLVDVSDRLPQLIRRPGLTSWSISDKAGALYDSMDAVPDNLKQNYKESMFPPTSTDHDLHLERCIRVYPHLQDTGGFFVAVLEKDPLTADDIQDDAVGNIEVIGSREDPFILVEEQDAAVRNAR